MERLIFGILRFVFIIKIDPGVEDDSWAPVVFHKTPWETKKKVNHFLFSQTFKMAECYAKLLRREAT